MRFFGSGFDLNEAKGQFYLLAFTLLLAFELVFIYFET